MELEIVYFEGALGFHREGGDTAGFQLRLIKHAEDGGCRADNRTWLNRVYYVIRQKINGCSRVQKERHGFPPTRRVTYHRSLLHALTVSNSPSVSLSSQLRRPSKGATLYTLGGLGYIASVTS